MKKHKITSIYILITAAVVFYFLAGILLNPLIIWTSLPLYISYILVNSAIKSNSIKKLFSAYGFMLFSIIFSIFYHVTWFIDWQGTKTSSSTSALIFIWLPLYSILIGLVGYVIGQIAGTLYTRKA